MNKKAEIWISAILYILIAATTMTLIIQAGLPMLASMKDRSVYQKTESLLVNLDRQIEEVAQEGEGSQRVVPIDLRAGKITIKNGKLLWEFDTETKIFEPKSRINIGNLVVSTNAGVDAYEFNDSYVLINKYLIVNLSKYATSQQINTSRIIKYIQFRSNNQRTNGTFSFSVGDDETSKVGTGFTFLKESGTNLGFATVVTKINSANFEYKLELTLESDADFIRINIKELKVK